MSMILAYAALASIATGATGADQAGADQPPRQPAPAGQANGNPPGAAQGRDGTLRLPPADDDVALPSVNTPGAGTGAPRSLRLDTVAGRSRPEYDPAGIRAGSLLIFPEVSSSVAYDSNVYRQPSGVSDRVGHLRGVVEVRSDLSRHALQVDGFVDQRSYARFASESALTYRLHAFGRLDIARGDQVTLDASRVHSVVDRGAAGEILTTRRPVDFDVTLVSAGGTKTFGRLIAQLGGTVSRSDYQDAQTPAGAPLDQQYRDFTLYQLRQVLGYALAAGPQLFLSVTEEARRYRVSRPPVDRDADTIEVLGGVRSDITPLLRGQLGVGFLYADFKDPTIRSRSALGLDIALDYLVTPLTTVRATARRQLQNVASAISPASLNTEGRIGLDHELLRNLILSASAGLQSADYVTLRGTVRRFSAEGGAQWLINRRLRMNLDLNFQRRTGGSQTISSGYDQTRATVGVAFRL